MFSCSKLLYKRINYAQLISLINNVEFSAKDRAEKAFAVSFVKLMQENGTTLKDELHELLVYKVNIFFFLKFSDFFFFKFILMGIFFDLD